MYNYKNIMLKSKYVLILIFSILAFSSCGLKELVGDIVNIEYNKPLNKTKSTTSACINGQNTSTYVSISKQKIKNKLFSLTEVSPLNSYFKSKNTSPSNSPHLHSSNSPPKYILFKKLKIALS